MVTSPTSVPAYAARLAIAFQEGPRNRLTTLFRILLVIPIVVVLALVPTVFNLPTVLMILFRQKYPRWWFDFNFQLTRFTTRVISYLGLLRDEYPSTDEEQAVHVEIDYPDAARDLNRWLPLVKWLLAIPHYILLIILTVAAVVAVVIAWFAILFTGSGPRGLSDFVQGVLRWWLRVDAYMFLLVTDRYPPFSLK